MKKTAIFFTGLFILFVSAAVQAQDKTTEFFLGKWNVEIIGTPNGDAKMTINIEQKDGKMEATITGEGVDPAKVDRVDAKESSVTLYWMASGYDVYLVMQKTDDNKVEGNLMDMFSAKIERAE
ncbi:MAG: hypothetical protein JW761_13965 [Prolixibacteraceae bacterium]|nr:hypothetical protein [Prolixibacteraceae bacterium]